MTKEVNIEDISRKNEEPKKRAPVRRAGTEEQEPTETFLKKINEKYMFRNNTITYYVCR